MITTTEIHFLFPLTKNPPFSIKSNNVSRGHNQFNFVWFDQEGIIKFNFAGIPTATCTQSIQNEYELKIHKANKGKKNNHTESIFLPPQASNQPKIFRLHFSPSFLCLCKPEAPIFFAAYSDFKSSVLIILTRCSSHQYTFLFFKVFFLHLQSGFLSRNLSLRQKREKKNV